jgi:hypothetical protein
MEVETNSPAGDGSSYSEDWAAIAQEETGQGGAGDAAPPPGGSGHDRSDPLGDRPLPSDRREFSPDAAPQPSSAAGQPAGSDEADDDIWAGAPAELRSAFEAERAGRAQAENTIRSNNARWSSAQRELNVIRAHQAQPASHRDAAPGIHGARSRSGRGDDGSDFGYEAAERDEELLRVGDEYPDIAMPLIEVIADLRAQVSELSTDASRRRELEQSQAELALQEQLAGEEQALARDHPDWDQVVRSQDFADWAMAQPRMVHEALLRNGEGIVDGAEASKILGDFKRDFGSESRGSGTLGSARSSIAQRRGRQMEGARHVPGRQGAIPGEGIGGSYSEEWKRQESEERRREASRR